MESDINFTKNTKRMWRQLLLTILTVCALMGWWGELYPQFTMVKGTYAVYDAESGKEIVREPDAGRDYWEILAADSDRIYMKSRLLCKLRALQEQRRGVHGSGVQ